VRHLPKPFKDEDVQSDAIERALDVLYHQMLLSLLTLCHR